MGYRRFYPTSPLVYVLCLAAVTVCADTATLTPTADATLFEDSQGTLADGAGQYLFAGRTNQPKTRRALLTFAVADAIPAGATITDVTLRMNMSRTVSTTHAQSLHRVLAAWGEGSADGSGEEGGGALADAGSATWIHAFRDTALWQTPGGDYEAGASASTTVGAVGSYSWSSAGMSADVQAWLDNPATNFGWLLRGDESAPRTAKRFDSRQHATAANRPTLTIAFDPAVTNHPPVVRMATAASRIYVGGEILVLLDSVFSDADGDSLSFAVDAVPAGIVALGQSGGNLAVSGIAAGEVLVTLAATDPEGAAAQTSIAIEVVGVPGDFDLNGAVDFDDFFAFADHFGQSSTAAGWDARFDLSANGAVDFDDFFSFADYFGLTGETAPRLDLPDP